VGYIRFIPLISNIYPQGHNGKEFMATLGLIEHKKIPFRLIWKEYHSLQRLLDIIASILAEEYIFTVKHNPDVFFKHGDPK